MLSCATVILLPPCFSPQLKILYETVACETSCSAESLKASSRVFSCSVNVATQLPTVSVWLVKCNMTLYIITSQMIYHCGGEPEQTMHCCHGTQAMDNNRICHRLLTFHERGRQYFVQPFLQSMKLLRLSLNFTLKLWGEFLALMSVNYAWIYLKWTQLQCVICTVWAACPCLSWSPVAMRESSLFLGLPSRRRCALAIALHRLPTVNVIRHCTLYKTRALTCV